MKVALCQMAIEFEKKEVNTRRAISFMEQARSAGADLVLFPEMSLTGFSMNILQSPVWATTSTPMCATETL